MVDLHGDFHGSVKNFSPKFFFLTQKSKQHLASKDEVAQMIRISENSSVVLTVSDESIREPMQSK